MHVRLVLLTFILFGSSLSAKEPKPYDLTSPPLAIYDRLGELKMGAVAPLGVDERKLLNAAWQLKSKNPNTPARVDETFLVDALLFSSGIVDAAQRVKYRAQTTAFLQQARTATAGAKNLRERGDLLMKFLHAGVMKKGYQDVQTSVSVVFDTGKYNCVSSSALYYLAGASQGMELRILSIPSTGFSPGHAALDLIDGTNRVQIEPTNPDGFDWGPKSKRPGLIVLGFVPDRKSGYEVDALGLPAMIYSNRGVAFVKDKQPQRLEAMRCYLCALALNPSDETAKNNLMALLVNWGPILADAKQFEDGIRVVSFGLSIDPKSSGLRNNHGIVWSRYIDDLLASGKDKEACEVIRRAEQATKGSDFQHASLWFCRLGEKRIKDKGWEAGFDVVERGLKVLPADDAKRLLSWRNGVYARWAQSLREKRDLAGAQKVLARVYALDPGDKSVLNDIAYHAQETLFAVDAKSGTAAAVAEHQSLRKAFPEVKGVAEAGGTYARRAIGKLADAQKFDEALRAVDAYAPLLAKPEERADLAAIAYDAWARSFVKRKEYKAAVDKYVEGLKAYPQQPMLRNNAVAALDQWARPAMSANNWDEAIRILKTGLSQFPGESHLERTLAYCEKMRK